jgi:hypothetical protein
MYHRLANIQDIHLMVRQNTGDCTCHARPIIARYIDQYNFVHTTPYSNRRIVAVDVTPPKHHNLDILSK